MTIASAKEPAEETSAESVAASQQNHYAEHLAEVNRTTDVIATDDIYNENGMLVASKGTHINHGIAKLIVNQKLVTPLEEQVQLENALNSKGLIGRHQISYGQIPGCKSGPFRKRIPGTYE